MVYAWEKYKLVLNGMEIAQMGAARTRRVIEAWAKESGVMNISNHEIRAVADFNMDQIVYTASVLSEGWTGIKSR